MKAGLLAVAAFAAGAVAQPHRRHGHFHEQRDVVVETQWATEIDVVTATAPAAYVYVDQYGNRIDAPASTPTSAVQHGNWGGDHGHGWSSSSSSEASAAPAATTTAAPVVVASPTTTPEAYTAPVVSIPVVSVPVVSVPAVSSAPVVVASSQAPVASSAPVSSGSGLISGLGVTYSPYTSGPCRDAGQVAKDIAGLGAYSTIRLYGTDCNQIANVMAAMTSSQKLMLGVFDIDSRLAGEVQSLIDQVNGNWDRVAAITIGNEQVVQGVPAGTVLAAVLSARTTLSKSFSGPIGTVDTVASYQYNAALCSTADQDTVFVNCHPFFTQGVTPEVAGEYVYNQTLAIQQACSVKNVIITETGWPSDTDNAALFTTTAPPNITQQASAIKSIKSAFSNDLFLFSAYNEAWKPAGALGIENFWGILGSSPNGN